MRVLVTGATGFVGRRLCLMLQEVGHQVVALVRRADAEGFVEQVIVERLDAVAVRTALGDIKFDAVVNLAAAGVHPADRDPVTLTQVNAIFPAELAAIAHDLGARTFVQIGSSAEYAGMVTSDAITEHSPLESIKFYGASKAAGSLLVQAWGAQLGLPVAVLRLFNVFGPGEAPHRLLPSLVSRLANGETVPLSVGTQLRDFMHVDDACSGIIVAMEALVQNPSLSGCYNLATGCATSVGDFARMVAAAMAANPDLLCLGELPLRPDDLPCVVGSHDKFKKAFGWSVFRPIKVTISMAVNEFLNRGRGGLFSEHTKS